jgi:hypothetical protein
MKMKVPAKPPAWQTTPWSATHKETLQAMLVSTEHDTAAIAAALAEIARLQFALETVAKIARATAMFARAATEQEPQWTWPNN